MPTDTILLEQESPETVATKPDQAAVEETLEAVLNDSRSDPQTFLDETVVPHGGE